MQLSNITFEESHWLRFAVCELANASPEGSVVKHICASLLTKIEAAERLEAGANATTDNQTCPTCNGDRMVESESGYIDCPTCGGSGENQKEEQRCPYHQHQRPNDPTPDYWEKVGSDRVCSYCGSWHPDEFLAFLKVAADPTTPGRINQSNKTYKMYVHRPGIANATEGAIKFYLCHLPETIDEETQKLAREALSVSFKKMMQEVDQTCINIGIGHVQDVSEK